jgi:polysaccharide pyruvyl transferase WcaK-like protein
MKNKACAHIIGTLPSPSELKGMLACSEVNITTRMHACILSTGASIPTISVNYLFKLKEYMHSLGLGDYSIDIEEFNADWALRAFDFLWQERPRWRAAISEAISKKQKQLDASMERFDALLSR